MEELRFTRAFGDADQLSYQRQYFDVPEGIERIEVDYSYPRFKEEAREGGTERAEANIVDLGLYDDSGTLRGWSGSQRRSVFVSVSDATPGYRRGPIPAGRWAVALGVYRVSGEVEVELAVRLVRKTRRRLAGDLHMHTENSDGSYPTASVIDQCRLAGLDFIALTDHNNFEQNREIGNPHGITVIAGTEYTNYRGHANFYFPGPNIEFDADPLSNSPEEMLAAFARARELGAVISLNHIDCDQCPWLFGFDEAPFDAVEVWNGPMKRADERAIERWHGMLLAGARLAAVGGSDTHRHEPGRTYGCPTTFVLADSASPADILAAVREGRSFLAESPAGPYPDIRIGDAGLGETARYAPGLRGEVRIESAKKGDTAILYDGGGNAAERVVPFSGTFGFSFPVEGPGFYRLEVKRDRLSRAVIAAVTNPVYVTRDA